LWEQRLRADRREREAHFVAIHFLAAEANHESDPDGPRDYASLLAPWGGSDSALGSPFADGLDYRPQNGSFTLEEPKARRISLFRVDRLIASDRRWPRWESSGEYARKFPEQEAPPHGYE
jgi:hypothetical protein